MGAIVIVAGGGIAPWKTATICLCIFLGPCALALLWFYLKVLLGIQRTMYAAVADALAESLGGEKSEAFRAEWHRVRNDHAAVVAALFGGDEGGFNAFRACLRSGVFTLDEQRHRSARDAWDRAYSTNGWELATIYFETLEMAEAKYRKDFMRNFVRSGRSRAAGANAKAEAKAEADKAWQEMKREPAARIALLGAAVYSTPL